MTTTYKLMSREDGEERKDDYDDAVKDYKKDLKEISDKYDEYSDYGYGYGYDYGYGYGNDYFHIKKSDTRMEFKLFFLYHFTHLHHWLIKFYQCLFCCFYYRQSLI